MRRTDTGCGRNIWTLAVVATVLAGAAAGGCGLSKEEAARKKAAQAAFIRAMDAAEQLQQQERATGQPAPDRFATAIDAAEEAVQLDPDVAPYWRLLGTLYATMGRDTLAGSLAEDAFAAAVSLEPKDVGARLDLAGSLMGRRAWSRALDQLEEAARIDRKVLTRPLVADMCNAYVADGLAERGEDFFRGFATKGEGPATSAPRLCLAVLLHEQGAKAPKKAAEAQEVLNVLAADAKAHPDDAAYAKALAQDWQGGGR